MTPVRIETPTIAHMDDFLRSVRRSRSLHKGLVSPPSTPEAFRAYLRRTHLPSFVAHLVLGSENALIGVVNISDMVRGSFCSAYLGYYAFAPHAGHGYMSAGLALVLRHAFRDLRLHRLEANIQPGNLASIRLVERHGFLKEGFSPNYLKVSGRWRDHERWALLRENWRRS